MRVVRVGSRDSKLAIAQAQMVIDSIKLYDSSIVTELITMKTSGDKILDRTLDKIGGKGLFVKELDEALIDNRVDITVHSFKDLPMEVNEDLPIVALSERADERDVLILPEGIADESKPIGSSSKRRMLQLNELGYSNIMPLRGNVITRLKKLDEGEYSAIVLAAAGLKRLGLEDRISSYFNEDEIIPCACQAIIAVQARKNEKTEYLELFHSKESSIVSSAERAFVTRLNGGCSSPIAAFARIEEEKLYLKALYYDESNNRIYKGNISGEIYEAEKIGILLADSLKKEAENFHG